MAVETRITPATVDTLAEKLGRVTGQLSDQERHVLAWILTRAAAARSRTSVGTWASAQGLS